MREHLGGLRNITFINLLFDSAEETYVLCECPWLAAYFLEFWGNFKELLSVWL